MSDARRTGCIGRAFERASEARRAALVIYLCAGDPDLATSVRLVVAAARAGADVIELGVPFSDPTADGPTIQRASERALARGTALRDVLEVVRQVRAGGVDAPILLFGYYNPILAYGEAELVQDAAGAGVDGLLVVDLPLEECEALRAAAVDGGLDYVPLVAPTTPEPRADVAAAKATAFLYYVSLTGVTGSGDADLSSAAARAAELGRRTGRPVAVGFGVRTPADAARVAAHADGVVVGSAVVAAIEAAADADAAEAAVTELVKSLAKATNRPAGA